MIDKFERLQTLALGSTVGRKKNEKEREIDERSPRHGESRVRPARTRSPTDAPEINTSSAAKTNTDVGRAASVEVNFLFLFFLRFCIVRWTHCGHPCGTHTITTTSDDLQGDRLLFSTRFHVTQLGNLTKENGCLRHQTESLWSRADDWGKMAIKNPKTETRMEPIWSTSVISCSAPERKIP